MIGNFIPFNKVIKILILADFIFYSAWGLIAPIVAIYFVGTIEGGNIQVIGIGAGVFFILKSILQIPIGKYLDRNHGERDDYWILLAGAFIASLVPLLYIVITQPWHLYAAQAVYAVGMAFAIPSWGGIFMRHVDKSKEAQSWSIESSAIGFGSGIAGIVGGTVASIIGFTPLFIAISIVGLISTASLFLIKKDILPYNIKSPRVKPFERP